MKVQLHPCHQRRSQRDPVQRFAAERAELFIQREVFQISGGCGVLYCQPR